MNPNIMNMAQKGLGRQPENRQCQTSRISTSLSSKNVLNPNLGIREILLDPSRKSKYDKINNKIPSQIDLVEYCKMQQLEMLQKQNKRRLSAEIYSSHVNLIQNLKSDNKCKNSNLNIFP